MKVKLFLLVFLLLIAFATLGEAQDKSSIDSWRWIAPLRTKKVDIEKAFGSSITKDKTHPFQTYVADFGKITVVYASKTKKVENTNCLVKKGTVLNYSVSPRKLMLFELGYDLNNFTKDSTYSPRELSYFNKQLGILIDTTIIDFSDKSQTEQVVMLIYHAPASTECTAST